MNKKILFGLTTGLLMLSFFLAVQPAQSVTFTQYVTDGGMEYWNGLYDPVYWGTSGHWGDTGATRSTIRYAGSYAASMDDQDYLWQTLYIAAPVDELIQARLWVKARNVGDNIRLIATIGGNVYYIGPFTATSTAWTQWNFISQLRSVGSGETITFIKFQVYRGDEFKVDECSLRGYTRY